MILFITLYSCSSDNDLELVEPSVLNTQLSYEKYISTKAELEKLFNGMEIDARKTRVADLSVIDVDEIDDELLVEKTHDLLEHWVADGVAIRNNILYSVNNGSLTLTDEEVEVLENMDDAGAAGMAYMINLYEIEVIKEGRSLMNCLNAPTLLGLGSGAFSYVDGTIGLMSAKTAISLGRAFVGRTLGWVGVAMVLYDIHKCMNSGGKEEIYAPMPVLKDKSIKMEDLEQMLIQYNCSHPSQRLNLCSLIDKLNNGELMIRNGEICSPYELPLRFVDSSYGLK